jgi:hypothetical protein
MRHGLMLTCAILLTVLAHGEVWSQSIDVSPTVDAPSALEILAGRYDYIGNPEKDHSEIEKSIEAAITSLGWLGRKIARSRLANHKELPGHIEISRVGNDVSVVMGTYSAIAPMDGSKRELVGPNGRDSKLHYELEDHVIVQYFVFEHAKRKSTYSLDKDGNLVMTVYMTSEKLASPIEYALVYEPAGRAEPAPQPTPMPR